MAACPDPELVLVSTSLPRHLTTTTTCPDEKVRPRSGFPPPDARVLRITASIRPFPFPISGNSQSDGPRPWNWLHLSNLLSIRSSLSGGITTHVGRYHHHKTPRTPVQDTGTRKTGPIARSYKDVVRPEQSRLSPAVDNSLLTSGRLRARKCLSSFVVPFSLFAGSRKLREMDFFLTTLTTFLRSRH